MKPDLFVIKEGKKLRCGYTTGSCAAGAAKAAVLMLKLKKKIDYIEIDTPANIRLKLPVNTSRLNGNKGCCSIVKDGGDDPDSTNGMEIFVEVEKRQDNKIFIDGGIGIGRINRKGLFGEIGEAAINPVPKQMITKEISEVCDSGYNVLIYAPDGEEIAKKTYNQNIGIEGGISIIGTKGIVYPMSEDALIKTIYLGIDTIGQQWGRNNIVLVPGNYGEKMANSLNPANNIVKVSNYIGDSIQYVYNEGFESVTLIGHIGKFAKLSIGAFNTHNRVCDGRVEAFIYYLALRGAPIEILKEVNNAITAEEALAICMEAGFSMILKDMEKGVEMRIKKYLKDEDYPVEVMIYSMEGGFNMG